MSLGLTALIISLVALAINAVNHFQIQRAIHTMDVDLRILYSDIRGDDFSAEEATKDNDDSQTQSCFKANTDSKTP